MKQFITDITPVIKANYKKMIVLIVILLLAFVTVWFFVFSENIRHRITDSKERAIIIDARIIDKNKAIMNVSKNLIAIQIEQISNLSRIYLAKPGFVEAIVQKRWQGALEIVEPILEESSYIERIFITDAEGTLKSDFPIAENVIGKNFAFRDWYIGAVRNLGPYLSEVYTRSAEPRHNVVSFATPILDRDKISGFFVIQLNLDIFKKWLVQINDNLTARVFIIDQRGHVVVHPDLDTKTKIIDYSLEPDVQELFAHGPNTEVILAKDIYLSSFGIIPEYQRGVISRLPVSKIK